MITFSAVSATVQSAVVSPLIQTNWLNQGHVDFRDIRIKELTAGAVATPAEGR